MKIKKVFELNDNEYKLKTTKKTIIEVDYSDLEDFINNIYGGNFDFVSTQEANNYSSYDFDVPSGYITFSAEEKIREGDYNGISVNQILQCLYEDDLIEAGDYLVRVSW